MPEEIEPRNPAFAVVCDIAASWEMYATTGLIPDADAPGLILHAAGATDEGIRTIAIWESEAAWLRHGDPRRRPETPQSIDQIEAPVRRQMQVRQLVDPERPIR